METPRDANPAPGFARHPDHKIDISPAGRRAIAEYVAFYPDRVTIETD